MKVKDDTGKFSAAELQELENFICNDLLSTELEMEWLSIIRIREDARSGYQGYWRFKLSFDTHNPDHIDGIMAVVVLNYYYVKLLPSPQRLEALKTVLAHEYGHHWTLSYLVVNQGIDVWTERMPQEYYQLRGLNEQTHDYDYSNGWHNCDKEIIAEDYRVLFSPDPHNQNHQMVVNDNTLALPTQEIKTYIKNLKM